MDESVITLVGETIFKEFFTISDVDVDPINVLNKIITILIDRINADKGAISIVDEITGDRITIIMIDRNAQSNQCHYKKENDDERGIKYNGSLLTSSSREKRGCAAEVPIKMRGKIIGIIEVISNRDDSTFSDDDLTLIKAVSDVIALPVDNIRLGRIRDISLRKISELMEISSILNSSLDPSIVRERAITIITNLLECDVASLLLVDEQNKELYFEVALGDKGDRVKEIRLKMGEGIAGWVATNNKPLLISDVKSDPRHSGRFDERSKFETHNMICVPMVVKGKVIGVLQAINKLGNRTFSQTDLDLFISLSHEVAIAVDNARLYLELKETFYQTSEALADAIEKRDPYTGNHTKRVMHYSMAISHFLDLTDEERENLRLAAILHDVGKIGVEDSVLRKDSALNNDEYQKIIRHPEIGVDILGHIKRLEGVIPGMKSHHERIDGQGYPDKISDREIPLIARIISVADTYDAMTTDRPYRAAMPGNEAVKELERFAGTQFDEMVVKAFIKAYENGYITNTVD